jgi:2-keto-3-deoxy-L-rhamnonate aldolase RhmA
VGQESVVARLQAMGSSDAVPIVRMPWNAAVQRIFAAARANGKVVCHHGSTPAVSAKFVQMGSMLCQIGNEMRMLSTATAEALKEFREGIA